MEVKSLKDFEATYDCRFHPTDWWHEVGCTHREWSKDELQDALNKSKQSNNYLVYLIGNTSSTKEVKLKDFSL